MKTIICSLIILTLLVSINSYETANFLLDPTLKGCGSTSCTQYTYYGWQVYLHWETFNIYSFTASSDNSVTGNNGDNYWI